MPIIFLRCLLMTAFLSYEASAGVGSEPSDPGTHSIDYAALGADNGRYDCTEVPESVAVCRMRVSPDIHELEALLAKGEHLSRRSDTLTFVYRGGAERVSLGGGLQYPMSRVTGTDLWTLTLRIERLDELALSYEFYTLAPGDLSRVVLVEPVEWRGPLAPAKPEEAENLKGTLTTREIQSVFLDVTRSLTIYEPPAVAQQPIAGVVYMADGKSVERFAKVVEPLIVSERLPRLMFVGLHAAEGAQRWHEYVFWMARTRAAFLAHERFFIEEVIPLVERSAVVPRTATGRALLGYSNGADWAVATTLRNPGYFSSAIAFSPEWPARIEQPSEAYRISFFVGAGTLETMPHKNALGMSALFEEHGVGHTMRQQVAGHDMTLWEGLLPEALMWTFERTGNADESSAH